MTDKIGPGAEPGIWAKVALALEAIDKSETDHVWDHLVVLRKEILALRTRVDELSQVDKGAVSAPGIQSD